MDAPLRLATSEGERWAYVADVLKETAEKNQETAVILARLTQQLDSHDRRISDLEATRAKATERALDQAAAGSGSGVTSSLATEAAQAQEQQQAFRLAQLRQSLGTSLTTQIAALIQNWRTAFLVASVFVNIVLALASHLSWHW